MKKNVFFTILLLGLFVSANAQQLAPSGNSAQTQETNPFPNVPKEKIKTDQFGTYYYDEQQRAKIYNINGETLTVLDDLVLSAKPRFNNQLDRNYYFFLNKRLARVYPLFLVALQQYRDVQKETAELKGAKYRKYMKNKQAELAAQYEKQLRNLTTTEGKIFAKLMYRATGKTAYEIIKELRGGWNAFWWNVKGNVADIELKKPYNPRRDRTDAYLESLLISNWNYGYLEPYEGSSDFKSK